MGDYHLPATDPAEPLRAMAERIEELERRASRHYVMDDDPRMPVYTATLPGSPVDGEEVYWQPGPGGYHWHLRRNAGGNRWDFLGGPPLMDQEAAQVATTSTGYSNLDTGLSITVPHRGYYIVAVGTYQTSYGGAMTPAGSGVLSTSDSYAAKGQNNTNSTIFQQSLISLPAGDLYGYYRSFTSGGSAQFADRRLSILPIYLY